MNRVAWITDIHLDCCKEPARRAYYDLLRGLAVDALLLGGDVADAPRLVAMLEELVAAVDRPIYFVLGNHDYYYSSLTEVRASIAALCRREPRLRCLTGSEPVTLRPGLGLVGHDGWADARLGDYERSLVMMNDYKLIAELAPYSKATRWPVLKSLGQQAAHEAEQSLTAALAAFPEVLFLTHVPPFREACWHQGQISSDEWLPHFTCQAMGEMLLETMLRHPDQRLRVLCGHTHSRGRCQPLPNLTVLTGQAEYGSPEVQAVFEFGA